MNKLLLFSLFTCVQWICFFLIVINQHNTHDEQLTLSSQNNKQLQYKVNTLEQQLQSKNQDSVALELEISTLKQNLQTKTTEVKNLQTLLLTNDTKKDTKTDLSRLKEAAKVQSDLTKLGNAPFQECIQSLRFAEPNCTTQIPLRSNNNTTHPYFQLQVQNMILEEDLDCFYETKFKGAVLYLGPRKGWTMGIQQQPKNRTDILLVSLKRLHKYYNSLHHYPIFVFHEDYTKEDIKNFRTQFGHPLHFVKVDFKALPPCASNATELSRWISNYGNPIGYRQMCRFWSGIVQNAPILNSFEYYLRLDDDTMMMDYVNYDLFEYMDKYNKTYVFQTNFGDTDHINHLWKLTSEWLKENNIEISPDSPWLKFGNYQGKAPYNNFHTSRFDFWKSKEVGDLFEYLENTECGFIQHAWGDANFHAVALGTLVEEQKRIVQLSLFPVQHNWHASLLGGDDWALDPDLIPSNLTATNKQLN